MTQNIDDLHERAGSQRVLHMHGELLKARCRNCEAVADLARRPHGRGRLSRCACAGALRPHVVWFGEMPLHLDEIDRALRDADLFVAIGTSGAVYPAAGFVAEARAFGVPTCEINLEAADNAYCFDEARYGPASETVPAWVEDVLKGDGRPDNTLSFRRGKPRSGRARARRRRPVTAKLSEELTPLFSRRPEEWLET